MRHVAVVLTSVALVGCSKELAPQNIPLSGDWVRALNRSLYYLPFVKNDADCGPVPEDARRVSEGNTVRLLPGMKLAIHWTNANVPRSETSAGNMQPPIIGMYEWTVPEHDADSKYASTDFLVFTELLSAWSNAPSTPSPATPVGPGQSLVAVFHAAAAKLPEQDFEKEVASKLLCPVVSSLRVSSRNELVTTGPLPCIADSMRKLFGPGSKRELENGARQALLFNNPLVEGCRDTSVFGTTPTYFDLPVPPLGDQQNAYLDRNAHGNPTYLEPLIAVRIEPEAMSRHVPIYWSVQDLERRLGVHVVALRRRLALVGPLETAAGVVDCAGWTRTPAATAPDTCGACGSASGPPPSTAPALCPQLASPGDYITIYLRPTLIAQTHGFGAYAVLKAGDNDNAALTTARADLLLAHGDVIIAERARDSDLPGMR